MAWNWVRLKCVLWMIIFSFKVQILDVDWVFLLFWWNTSMLQYKKEQNCASIILPSDSLWNVFLDGGHVAVGLSCAWCAEMTLSASKSAERQLQFNAGTRFRRGSIYLRWSLWCLEYPKMALTYFYQGRGLRCHCINKTQKMYIFKPLLSFSHPFTMIYVPCKRVNAFISELL